MQDDVQHFGCLINGQAYTPKGRIGLGANFDVSYDPTYKGGHLIVRTYQVLEQNHKKLISLSCAPVSAVGVYSLNLR